MREKACLVIPCYNEERRLPVEEFERFAGQIRFVFVNDGSTDGTAELVRRRKPANAFFLDLPRNGGKSEAVRQGMLYAATLPETTPRDWIGYWDADLATPLGEVEGMLAYAGCVGEPVDALFGSRIYRLGSHIRRSFKRHLFGRAFVTVASVLLGIGSYDSQCGAKLFRRDLIERAFGEPFLSRWIFDVEIVLRLRNAHVVEYPLRSWADVSGSNVRPFRMAPRVARDLWRIRRKYGRIG